MTSNAVTRSKERWLKTATLSPTLEEKRYSRQPRAPAHTLTVSPDAMSAPTTDAADPASSLAP